MTAPTLKPGREEFRKLAHYGNLIPVYTEIVSDAETPVSAFSKIDDGGLRLPPGERGACGPGGALLVRREPPRGSSSAATGGQITVVENGEAREFETGGDPLAELQKLMARYIPVPAPHLPRFVGGAVGYLGYDMVRFFEPSIGEPPPDALELPESLFMVTDTRAHLRSPAPPAARALERAGGGWRGGCRLRPGCAGHPAGAGATGPAGAPARAGYPPAAAAAHAAIQHDRKRSSAGWCGTRTSSSTPGMSSRWCSPSGSRRRMRAIRSRSTAACAS